MRSELPHKLQPEIPVTCVDTIMSQMPRVFKPQRRFMISLIAAMQAFSGHATMANLSRYGAGSERRIARWGRKGFDFTRFNMKMPESEGVLEHRLVAALDPSFIPTAGKHTWELASSPSAALKKIWRHKPSGLKM